MVSLLIAGIMQTALVVPNPRVLVFSKTTGFRHDSIESAVAAIKKMGADHDFKVDATEDASVFTEENLKNYDLICFASTTGTILDANQKKAMEKFVSTGKGWMGIHSASDTEYDWPWYAELVGAYFKSHPPGGQRVHVKIENRGNPSTIDLPRFWVRPDEWYDWRANPRANVQVLASLDESFYRPENPQDHPIAWCHWQGKGRSWYTEMGHFKEAFSDPVYLGHLYGGLMWAAQGSQRFEGAETFRMSSEKTYGDCYIHAEFKIPKGGRSSIGLGGTTQVAIADSSNIDWNQLKATDCGGVNGVAPITNAFAGANVWNTLDMVFNAKKGQYDEIRLNGIVIQRNVKAGSVNSKKVPVAIGEGNSMFQNTWVKSLS